MFFAETFFCSNLDMKENEAAHMFPGNTTSSFLNLFVCGVILIQDKRPAVLDMADATL